MSNLVRNEEAALGFLSELCEASRKLKTGTENQELTKPKRGRTLRPGVETPLWNLLRGQVHSRLERHGAQAKLARELGLHRQTVNSFFSSGSRMPDAERTLKILAWLLQQEP